MPVERCSNCGEIEDNCNCHSCDACGERYACEDYCHECERCQGCCRCGEAEVTPRYTHGSSTARFHGNPSRRYPRYLGVEIECGTSSLTRDSQRKLDEIVNKWGAGIHDDGSISYRLGTSMEIVSAPARGDKFVEQVKELTKAIRGTKAKVDSSCGLHVHVDVRDFTPREILNVVRAYSVIEPALYEVVAPSRATGSYSGPWGRALTPAGVLDTKLGLVDREKRLDIATYGSEEEARDAKRSRYKHGSRYHGLNLNAIAVHGTIEFRMHHGTTDSEKILMWAAVCSAIVDFCANQSEDYIAKLGNDPWTVLAAVVRDRAVVKWLKDRKTFFVNRERQRRGLPPIAGTAAASPRSVEGSEAA